MSNFCNDLERPNCENETVSTLKSSQAATVGDETDDNPTSTSEADPTPPPPPITQQQDLDINTQNNRNHSSKSPATHLMSPPLNNKTSTSSSSTTKTNATVSFLSNSDLQDLPLIDGAHNPDDDDLLSSLPSPPPFVTSDGSPSSDPLSKCDSSSRKNDQPHGKSTSAANGAGNDSDCAARLPEAVDNDKTNARGLSEDDTVFKDVISTTAVTSVSPGLANGSAEASGTTNSTVSFKDRPSTDSVSACDSIRTDSVTSDTASVSQSSKKSNESQQFSTKGSAGVGGGGGQIEFTTRGVRIISDRESFL